MQVALPLLLGSTAYALLSPGFDRYLRAPVFAPIAALRRITLPLAGHVPAAIRFHFADGAWGWSLGACLALVWLGAPEPSRRSWFAAGAVLTAGVECAQFLGLIPGTFDPIDIAVSLIAYVCAWRLVTRASFRTKDLSYA